MVIVLDVIATVVAIAAAGGGYRGRLFHLHLRLVGLVGLVGLVVGVGVYNWIVG